MKLQTIYFTNGDVSGYELKNRDVHRSINTYKHPTYIIRIIINSEPSQNDKVTNIGDEAFLALGPSNIVSIIFGPCVADIGDDICNYFSEDKNMLRDVVFGEDVTKIGTNTFANCNELKSVAFLSNNKLNTGGPNGANLFSNCKNVSVVGVKSDLELTHESNDENSPGWFDTDSSGCTLYVASSDVNNNPEYVIGTTETVIYGGPIIESVENVGSNLIITGVRLYFISDIIINGVSHPYNYFPFNNGTYIEFNVKNNETIINNVQVKNIFDLSSNIKETDIIVTSSNNNQLTIPYNGNGILTGVRPTPAQFYPSQTPVDSQMNTNARHTYLRASITNQQQQQQIALGKNTEPLAYSIKSSQRVVPVSAHKNYISPVSSSLHINSLKANAIGQSSYKVNLPNSAPIGSKSYYHSGTRSYIRRARSGGCVAPKKKGSIYNTSLNNVQTSVWGVNRATKL